MTNQIPLTPTATVIMLPQDATDVRIGKNMFGEALIYREATPYDTKEINLPACINGTWQLHQNAFDVSDDVLDSMELHRHEYTALLKSKRVYAVNPYGEKPPMCICSPSDDNFLNYGYAKEQEQLSQWQTAQLTTGRYCLIIKN